MSKAEFYKVKILNWEKWNGGKKTSQWFKLSSQFSFDHKISSLTNSQFRLFIELLQLAANSSTNEVHLTGYNVCIGWQMRRYSLSIALSKLAELQLIEITDKRDKIRKDKKEEIVSPKAISAVADHVQQFFDAYNLNSGILPKANKLTRKRKSAINQRWNEKPDLDYWVTTIKRMAASEFCTGKTGWTADLDFLLRPDSHVKINEGKYDNRKQIKKSVNQGLWDLLEKQDEVIDVNSEKQPS